MEIKDTEIILLLVIDIIKIFSIIVIFICIPLYIIAITELKNAIVNKDYTNKFIELFLQTSIILGICITILR